MRRKGRAFVLGAALLAMACPLQARAQEHPYQIEAEWAGEPCTLPAALRVTLTNSGETSFYVPRSSGLGRGRPINLVAEVRGMRGSTWIYSYIPYGPEFFREANFVRLTPGESHTYEVTFDGTLTVHGVPNPPVGDWGPGRVRLYYTFLPQDAARMPSLQPILTIAYGETVYSDWLVCS